MSLSRGRGYADAPYPAYGLVVELTAAPTTRPPAARVRDAERDLDLRVATDVMTAL